MNKFLFYFFLTIVTGSALFFIREDTGLGSFLINVLAAAFIFLLQYILENRKHLGLLILVSTKYYNKQMRFSISYLYQIKVDGKYLLHRGSRIKHQFQPIGGVYKRYRESFYSLQKLQVSDDDNIPIDDKSIDDLRVKLPGRFAIKFLKWYNSQLGREVSPYREFHEEMIRTEYVTQKIFPYTNYIHLKRVQTPIHFSEYFQCYEILIAEIFMLMPNEEQKNELRLLMAKSSDDYIWVDEQAIERLGANLGIVISPTAKWIL